MFKNFIIIFFGFIFFVSIGLAFDNHVIHPDLSRAAISTVEKETKYSITSEQKEWIVEGSIAEDTDPRYRNHFYNPSTGEGLDDYEFFKVKVWHFTGISAKEWAFKQDSATGDYSVGAILDNYREGNVQRAYLGVGHIIHLVQDMAVPAHTRNDAHPNEDPFEGWAEHNGKINYNNLYLQEINNIGQAFDELANYSHNNFFSKDTINIPNLNENNLSLEKDINGDDAMYLYNDVYKLIKVKRKRDYYEYSIDFKVNLDYWNMLYPKAVGYSAGTINWFLKEFEKIDKEKQEKLSKLELLQNLLVNMKSDLEYVWGDGYYSTRDRLASTWSGVASFFDSFNTFTEYYAESVEDMGTASVSKTTEASNWLIEKGKVLGESMDFGKEEEGRIAGGVSKENQELNEEMIGVKRVIDGDTIELVNGELVRYIGIDTPELNKPGADDDECLAWVARIRNMNLLSSGNLKLIKDNTADKDKYGRLLRYVYVGGVFVNEVLAREGLAEIFFCQPGWKNCLVTSDKDRENIIISAHEDAKNNNRGIFSSVCEEKKETTEDVESPQDKTFDEISDEEIDKEIKKAESYLYMLGGNSNGSISGSNEIPESENKPEDKIEIDTFLVSYSDEVSSSTMANFSFSSSANSPSYQYNLNGADWIDCSSDLILENLSDFVYLIEARSCQDEVCDESPIDYSWAIDTISASSSIVSIEKIDDNYNVSWEGEDTGVVISGLDNFDIEYKIDDGNWTTWLQATTSLGAIFEPNESFVDLCFNSKAYDVAGNEEIFNEEKILCYSHEPLVPYFDYFNIINLTSSSTVYTASSSIELEYSVVNQDLVQGYYYGEKEVAPNVSSLSWSAIPVNEFILSNGEGEKKIFAWVKYNSDQMGELASSTIILDQTNPLAPMLSSLYYEDGFYFVGTTTLDLFGAKEIGVDKIVFDNQYYNATTSEEVWRMDNVAFDFVCGEKNFSDRISCVMNYCQDNPEECSDQTNIYKRSKEIGAQDEAGNVSDLEILNFKYDPSPPSAVFAKEFHSNAYTGVFLAGLASDHPRESFSYKSRIKNIYWQYRQDELEEWQDIILNKRFFASDGGIDLYYFEGEENQDYIFQFRAEDNVGHFSDWSGDSGKLASLSLGESYPVLSEVYGGGGNSGSYYKNDFIEIYNPSDKSISLEGWSVQYASATSDSYNIVVLSGDIESYGYYLVKLREGSGGEIELDSFDAEGDINMSATQGKVALVNNQEVITGVDDENVVDFLGYGSANEKEGYQTALSLSNTTSAERRAFVNSTYELMQVGGEQESNGNGWDTNQNRDDWIVRDLLEPQSSGSAVEEPFSF